MNRKTAWIGLGLLLCTAQVWADAADRTDRRGDRIENRLDNRGDRVENRFDRHLDRRGREIDQRTDRRASRRG